MGVERGKGEMGLDKGKTQGLKKTLLKNAYNFP